MNLIGGQNKVGWLNSPTSAFLLNGGEGLLNEIDSLVNADGLSFQTKEEVYKKIEVNSNLNQWLGNDVDFLPCLCTINLNSRETLKAYLEKFC